METFYLGTHHTHWLEKMSIPMFVSLRRLSPLKRLPKAIGPWALDSGGFTELSMYGRWETSEERFIDLVRDIRDRVGNMQWASPQDWMCEPAITAKTGLSVTSHQYATLGNFFRLRRAAPDIPWIPVLQGWTINDYRDHVLMYHCEHIDLAEEPLVGLGTMCRRQNTKEAEQIVRFLHGLGIKLHVFGAKISGIAAFHDAIVSADSMAWSYRARRMGRPAFPECTHKTCANCRAFAVHWRDKVLKQVETPFHQLPINV